MSSHAAANCNIHTPCSSNLRKKPEGQFPPALHQIEALSWISPLLHTDSIVTFTFMHFKSHCATCKAGENKIHRIWRAIPVLPPATSTCPTARKRCTLAPNRRMGVQIKHDHRNHRKSASIPAVFRFLSLLKLPVQSTVSIAFVYWDLAKGQSELAPPAGVPLQAQSQQHHRKPALSKAAPCMGTWLACHTKGCISQNAPVLARQKVGSNCWPMLSCSDRKRNAAAPTQQMTTLSLAGQTNIFFPYAIYNIDKLISLQSPAQI